MADKQVGASVDSSGNNGLSQAEADKARAWAKRHGWEARTGSAPAGGELRRMPPDCYADSVTRDASVTLQRDAEESLDERKKRLSKERSAAYRARRQ